MATFTWIPPFLAAGFFAEAFRAGAFLVGAFLAGAFFDLVAVFFLTGALALPFLAVGLTFLKLICILVPLGSTKSLMDTGRSPLFGSIVKDLGWTGALPAGLNAGFLTFAPRPLRVTFAPYKYIDR